MAFPPELFNQMVHEWRHDAANKTNVAFHKGVGALHRLGSALDRMYIV